MSSAYDSMRVSGFIGMAMLCVNRLKRVGESTELHWEASVNRSCAVVDSVGMSICEVLDSHLL